MTEEQFQRARELKNKIQVLESYPELLSADPMIAKGPGDVTEVRVVLEFIDREGYNSRRRAEILALKNLLRDL